MNNVLRYLATLIFTNRFNTYFSMCEKNNSVVYPLLLLLNRGNI